jgi:hypothetical protein
VKRERGDLEAEPPQRQHHAEQDERMAGAQRARDAAEIGRARDAVDERQAVDEHRGGHGAHQEELQRSLDRLLLTLEEAGQVVERDRHQLEGHEQ